MNSCLALPSSLSCSGQRIGDALCAGTVVHYNDIYNNSGLTNRRIPEGVIDEIS